MSDGSDLAWLGLERHDATRWSFELRSGLTRPDGKLFGGTGLAAMVAIAEAETGRDLLWSTVQFVGSAELGERIDCELEVLAGGRRTSQVRFTASVGERIVLAGVGSAGLPRDNAVDGQMPVFPDVVAPDDAPPWGRHGAAGVDADSDGAAAPMGWMQHAELRQASASGSMWARAKGGRHSRATIAFIADMVPTSVVRAIGLVGGGTSLDNSVRYGRLVDTEWVLLDMDPWLASGGYLHGGARIWSRDGVLLGVASQTAAAMAWPPPTA
ncbi:MAG TPA: thioesterase family protein [Acidimicrobiales bacterium]|jgi:acyl-CoA thioesterase II|nr:thioesterase family protein [Acidimicrobiales bacterium]